MSIKLSTGLRNALAGMPDLYSAITISFTVTSNTVSDSASLLLSEGFRPGDLVEISSTSGTNDCITRVTSVASTGASMVVEADLSTEDAATAGTVVITTVTGKSYADIFRNHVIGVYSGVPPATADAVETGTLLILLTKASGAFVKGTLTNGLNFDVANAASGVIEDDGNVISGVGLASGSASYYRRYDNGYETGASSTAKRLQGTVGTSNADLILDSITITEGATTTASSQTITIPAA